MVPRHAQFSRQRPARPLGGLAGGAIGAESMIVLSPDFRRSGLMIKIDRLQANGIGLSHWPFASAINH
jgi:hypothetical protein